MLPTHIVKQGPLTVDLRMKNPDAIVIGAVVVGASTAWRYTCFVIFK
jgi:hypothetical protein